jgi:hypothetical protein
LLSWRVIASLLSLLLSLPAPLLGPTATPATSVVCTSVLFVCAADIAVDESPGSTEEASVGLGIGTDTGTDTASAVGGLESTADGDSEAPSPSSARLPEAPTGDSARRLGGVAAAEPEAARRRFRFPPWA